MAELITGSGGQLGQELRHHYPNAIAVDHQDLDISNQTQVEGFNWQEVEVIFNAAAYTKVDESETPEGKTEAWAANHIGTKNLGRIALKRSIPLLHVSTDYVFDGTKKVPYMESDVPNPQNEYGKSKLAGEKELVDVPTSYIIRTSWVIGNGPNFVRTMLQLGKKKDELTIVEDQTGRPTFSKDLASALSHLYENKVEPGIYHFSNDGQPVSWKELAETVFRMTGIACEVHGTTTNEYFKDKPRAAARPLNSVFDLAKIKSTGLKIRDWQIALEEYIQGEAA